MAAPGGTLVDGSAAVTGADQTVFAENLGRQYLLIQNLSTVNDLWVNFGIAAVASRPSIKLLPSGYIEFGDHTGVVPTAAVHVIGTAGQDFTAKEA